MKKTAVYARVSTREQAEGHSLGSQMSRSLSYLEAKQNDDDIKNKVAFYCDPDPSLNDGKGYDPSGGNLDRPALQKMLNDIKLGKISQVIVTSLSRLSRTAKDHLELYALFNIYDVEFIAVEEGYDTTTSMGRFVRDTIIRLHQLEREQIIERTCRGIDARASHPSGFSTPETFSRISFVTW